MKYDFSNFKIQTDLAIESKEMVSEEKDIEIDGVAVEIEEKEGKKLKITRVNVFNEQGSASIGKPIGKYITIESNEIKENDTDIHRKIAKNIAKELKLLHKTEKESKALVIGLGNWNVTADSLGPKVVSKTIVTRHLYENNVPDIDDTFGQVSAFIPGVMGLTGIETSDIVKGIVDKTKPDYIVVIDSLAARNVSRVNTTIQLSDSGIFPGSGVGNKRREISKETMGVPVIAIGVPTVVHAATLVSDVVDNVNDVLKNSNTSCSISENQKYEFIDRVLSEEFQNLFVTPKEEDIVIRRIRSVISDGLNSFFHHGISVEDVREYNS